MADFGDFASGAASGAMTGAAVGPWGALAGGLVGGVMSMFEKKPEKFQDPMSGIIQGQIAEDMQSNVGAQQAAQARGVAVQQGDDYYRKASNDPSIAGNAGRMTSVYNNLQHNVQQGAISANLQGAAYDQNTRHQGLQLAQEQNKFNFGKFQDQRSIDMQPSGAGQALKNLLVSGAGSMAGALSQKGSTGGFDWLFGGGKGTTTGTTTDTTTDSAGGGGGGQQTNYLGNISGDLQNYINAHR